MKSPRQLSGRVQEETVHLTSSLGKRFQTGGPPGQQQVPCIPNFGGQRPTGTVAGTYTWTVHYSGDPNNNDANEQSVTTEQTVVGAASLSLVTTASVSAVDELRRTGRSVSPL